MNDQTLLEVSETLVEMIGGVNLIDPDDVWSKISRYKNWTHQKPATFAIQGRIIESADRKMIEFDSISVPGFDFTSFSFQKTYPRDGKKMNESYAFSIRYPQRLLVIESEILKPIAKIINLVNGSISMS